MAASLERKDTDVATPQVARACHNIRRWLTSPGVPFTEQYGYVPASKANYSLSPCPERYAEEEGEIMLVQQFYVAPAEERHKENVECLCRNLKNKHIDRIVLLNERTYTDVELGLCTSQLRDLSRQKLQQVPIGARLTYARAFDYAATLGRSTFVVLANTDIFFGDSLANVRRCGLRSQRRVLAQLRHEHTGGADLTEARLFGTRNQLMAAPHSQDAWIWHSAHVLAPELRTVFDMALGTPGCDNRVLHWFGVAGFERFNVPILVKTYHYHVSALRNHHKDPKAALPPPYHMLYPYFPMAGWRPDASLTFDIMRGNEWLRNFISASLAAKTNFTIPRLAGIENDVATLGAELEQMRSLSADRERALELGLPRLRKHAGIQLTTRDQVQHYSRAYLGAFHAADAYFTWAPWGNVARHYAASYQFVETNFRKPKLDARVLDVFDAVQCGPWTRALKGRRILVVSAFAETIRKQVERGVQPYPIDLFPGCTFVFIRPPQTQGGNPSRPFATEHEDLVTRIREIKDDFDVALCSCGGYGNPLCASLRDMGKSAIYVGGVLQMYFGVYGSRWERENAEILEAYKHDGWVRPSERERPAGHEEIEKGCYW